MFDRPRGQFVAPTEDAAEPSPAARRAPTRREQRRTVILGGIAIALLLAFWLIKMEFVKLDAVRAGVIGCVAKICPGQTDTYTYLNEHYSTAGRTEDAVDVCEKLVSVEPNDPYAHVLLGEAYRNVSRSGEAMLSFDAALALDPNCYEAYLGAGQIHAQAGRYTEAAQSYQQAVKVKPDSAPAHVSLGLAFSNLGRYEEAMQAFQEAKRLDPLIGDVQVISSKACLDTAAGKKTAEHLKGAVATEQGLARARFNLGRAYVRVGDMDLARQEHQVLMDLDSGLAAQLLNLIEK